MKGLFVKDLKLMMLQKNFLLLILAIVIGMMIFTDDVIFPLGFLSFIVSLFTVSTISYDDFDNGNAFLFTLPITRNHYVSEKYFLGLLLGCMAWVLATVLGIITTVLKDTLPITDLVQSSLMILRFRSRMSAVRKKCGGLYLQHRGGRTAGLRGNEQRASGCGACHGDCEK